MTKIINVETKEEREIKDGSELRETTKEMGVIFGCEDGQCGTCMIEIEEGEDNLNEMTEQEKRMGMDPKHRLACQCRIKKGNLKIRY